MKTLYSIAVILGLLVLLGFLTHHDHHHKKEL
jgi:hypothetical protein